MNFARRGLALLLIALHCAVGLLALGLLALTTVIDEPGRSGSTFPPPITLAYPAFLITDPLFWELARNSLLISGSVTVCALCATLAVSRCSGYAIPGQHVLKRLALIPLAFPPAASALGLHTLVTARLGIEIDERARLLLIVVVELLWAIPLMVGCTCLDAAARHWRESARRFGGRPAIGRAWRSVVYSLVRPRLLTGCALVFALSLAEPAVPLIFGLDRTLAATLARRVTLADSTQGFAFFTLATWAIGAVLAFLVRARLSSRESTQPISSHGRPLQDKTRTARAPLPNALVIAGSLMLWISLSWSPVLGLVQELAGLEGIRQDWLATTSSLWNSDLESLLLDTFATAAMVACLVTPAAILARRNEPTIRTTGGLWRYPAPLLVGCAVWVGWLWGAQRSEALGNTLPSARAAQALLVIAWSWCLFVSSRHAASGRASARDHARAEAARGFGAKPLRVWWLATGRRTLHSVVSIAVATFLIITCDASASLLFTPTTRFCTLGTAWITWAQEPDRRATACLLALIALVTCALARLCGAPVTWFGLVPTQNDARPLRATTPL